MATENQQAKTNDVIEVKTGVYLHKTQTNIVKDSEEHTEDNNEQCICADTLIIFSKLSLYDIKQIFNEPQDIFPSDIGEETDLSQPTFFIDDNGELIPITKLFCNDYFILLLVGLNSVL